MSTVDRTMMNCRFPNTEWVNASPEVNNGYPVIVVVNELLIPQHNGLTSHLNLQQIYFYYCWCVLVIITRLSLYNIMLQYTTVCCIELFCPPA